MLRINPKYITDQAGKRISVVISVSEFESLMEKLEEIEDVLIYDKVKQSDEPSISIDEAFELLKNK